ncbi:MAG: hypothetical protein JWM16_4081 [Verrucomicrobiales bacterium]|nr:hypothetical protein [Verrucomicrobiales bacterium]
MNAKYSFRLESRDRRHELPGKIIVGQEETETINHVMLKLLAYVLFYRERLQLEVNLHQDSIPFKPDLVQLDYELRPKLWVECGECSVTKLDKLAVKVPEAEIWVVKKSPDEVESIMRGMAKEGLRRDRYDLIAFDFDVFQELCGLLSSRNQFTWIGGSLENREMQFDFNGLWFDTSFIKARF